MESSVLWQLHAKTRGYYYCHNVEATKPVMFAQHLCQSLQPLWIHLYDWKKQWPQRCVLANQASRVTSPIFFNPRQNDISNGNDVTGWTVDNWNRDRWMEWGNQPPILLLHRRGHGWCRIMPSPAFCNHTRSVCPISVTRLETDLAGVWLIRLLPDTDCRLQLSLNVQTVAY